MIEPYRPEILPLDAHDAFEPPEGAVQAMGEMGVEVADAERFYLAKELIGFVDADVTARQATVLRR